MDLAYDHIHESTYANADPDNKGQEGQSSSLNNDLQDAYKAFSASPWGVRIGGFLGTVKKQGESVYSQAQKEFAQAQKEVAELGEDATKGLTGLRESIMSRTRSLSLNTAAVGPSATGEDNQTTPTNERDGAEEQAPQESETVLSRLRSEAAKRFKDLQKAEDAADEALLRFGSNVRNFLKDAISVAPPSDSEQGSTLLFESKDASGKRAFHASRFDAQLHVIHTTADGFNKDPSGDGYAAWSQEFDVDKRTEEISEDLVKYPELRATMDKLVPETVSYVDFWKRYYFLRRGIETAEERRKELLKAAAAEDEVGWGDDSDDEEPPVQDKTDPRASMTSVNTIQPSGDNKLKPIESRKSNDEKSQADSEASYDVVGAASGKTSQAPNSPEDSKKDEDSDDDWE